MTLVDGFALPPSYKQCGWYLESLLKIKNPTATRPTCSVRGRGGRIIFSYGLFSVKDCELRSRTIEAIAIQQRVKRHKNTFDLPSTHSQVETTYYRSNQRSQRDDSRIQEERNKANGFTYKLQYDVSIFLTADSQILRNVHS